MVYVVRVACHIYLDIHLDIYLNIHLDIHLDVHLTLPYLTSTSPRRYTASLPRSSVR